MFKNNYKDKIFINNAGLEFKVIEYINAKDVTIQFIKTNVIKKHLAVANILKGKVLHPLIYTIYDNDIIKCSNVESNFSFLISKEDLDRVICHRWFKMSTGYIASHIDGKHTFLHRFLLNLTNSKDICDHKSGDKLDNTRNNLRVCSRSENNKNKKGYGSIKYKGVSKTNYGKYFVQFKINNKQTYFGCYSNIDDAAKKANEVMLKYHGEFINLNEIE